MTDGPSVRWQGSLGLPSAETVAQPITETLLARMDTPIWLAEHKRPLWRRTTEALGSLSFVEVQLGHGRLDAAVQSFQRLQKLFGVLVQLFDLLCAQVIGVDI